MKVSFEPLAGQRLEAVRLELTVPLQVTARLIDDEPWKRAYVVSRKELTLISCRTAPTWPWELSCNNESNRQLTLLPTIPGVFTMPIWI
jgi:hypothetical protein